MIVHFIERGSSCRATAQPAAKRGEAGTPEDRAARKNAGTPRKVSTPVAISNAWSQDPWRAQQQWGWQWGSGQQRGVERREWRTPQPTLGQLALLIRRCREVRAATGKQLV